MYSQYYIIAQKKLVLPTTYLRYPHFENDGNMNI